MFVLENGGPVPAFKPVFGADSGFSGTESAIVQSAIIMTVLPNCKMHGINPEEYLKDVLSRLPHINQRPSP